MTGRVIAIDFVARRSPPPPKPSQRASVRSRRPTRIREKHSRTKEG